MGQSKVFLPLADRVIVVHHVALLGICSMWSYSKPSWSLIVPSSSSPARQSVEDANNVCANNFPFLSNMALPIIKLRTYTCNRMSQTATAIGNETTGPLLWFSTANSGRRKKQQTGKCSHFKFCRFKISGIINRVLKRFGLVTNPKLISSRLEGNFGCSPGTYIDNSF